MHMYPHSHAHTLCMNTHICLCTHTHTHTHSFLLSADLAYKLRTHNQLKQLQVRATSGLVITFPLSPEAKGLGVLGILTSQQQSNLKSLFSRLG